MIDPHTLTYSLDLHRGYPMAPSFRCFLVMFLAAMIVLFAIDPAWGQRMRPRPGPLPPQPPTVRPGPIPSPAPIIPRALVAPPAPVVGNPMEKIWTCPTCKRELGRGLTPPASVVCCGQTFTNGLPSQPFSPADLSGAASTAGGVFIAMGIALILFGLVVLGGVGFLVVQSQRSAMPPLKRRRPRRED